MSQSMLKAALSLVLAMLLPAQLLAADSASAMLYSNGTAWVNGSAVPKSAAYLMETWSRRGRIPAPT